MPFQGIEDFRDIESINAFRDLTGRGMDEETVLRYIRYKSRDNARTPFQWDDSQAAGFTTGTPWIMVNPNYKEINAKRALEEKDSVFYYYQKLIHLRKQYPVIVYGHYDLLLPDSRQLYVYTREYEGDRLLTICNFTGQKVEYTLLDGFKDGEILISNTGRSQAEEVLGLEPYEALVLYVGRA